MGRLVGFVFKFLGISIIAMIILDASTMLVDAFSAVTKIQTVADSMQLEVARHNCLTVEAESVYDAMLAEIDASSSVFSDLKIVKASVCESSSPYNVKNYGEMHDLKIIAVVHPYDKFIRGSNVKNMLWRSGGLEYPLIFDYKVPCLRYLK